MAAAPLIYIVCSDRHRNGKTLLARVLVDSLMIDGRDPFVIDAGYPEGPLRNCFPGRTVLVDFGQMIGRMKLFDTILDSPGRDYVIDLPAPQTVAFFEAAHELNFFEAAREAGFGIVILFIIDKTPGSLETAARLGELAMPDALVPVRNQYVGSSLPESYVGPIVEMPALYRELVSLIEDRRFSLRLFLMGEEQLVPQHFRAQLKSFLFEVISGLRDIEPAMTLSRVKA